MPINKPFFFTHHSSKDVSGKPSAAKVQLALDKALIKAMICLVNMLMYKRKLDSENSQDFDYNQMICRL